MTKAVACQFNVFENSKVRSVFHNGELFFSIIDIISILTESPFPKTYWDKMKSRELSQLYPFWGMLKLSADDGKLRLTDCTNEQGIYRIMLYVKSPKVDDFKEWVTSLIKRERLESQNPESIIERGIDQFKKKGKSDKWIKKRIEGIQTRKSYTSTLQNAGLVGKEIGYITANIHKGLTGKSPSEHKHILNVKDTPRNYMNFYELNILDMMEYAHEEKIKDENLKGYEPVKVSTKPIIKMGSDMKNIVEKQLGKSISSIKKY